jgi:glycine cleavage system transcriptional repressor
MKQRVVISGTGPDQPGIVAAITHVLNQYNANIEDSSMTRLAREFATILVVAIPPERSVGELTAAIKQLEQSHHLSLLIRPLSAETDVETPHQETTVLPYMISVAGYDRTGITFHISQKLAELNINITDLSAQTIPGDKGLVYIMMVEVEIPKALDIQQVELSLQAVAQSIGMEVQVRPLDALAL